MRLMDLRTTAMIFAGAMTSLSSASVSCAQNSQLWQVMASEHRS